MYINHRQGYTLQSVESGYDNFMNTASQHLLCFVNKPASSVRFWRDCMTTGAIYKKPYSLRSIETNLTLIKHYLKHLKPDYSNIKEAYIKTKMETTHLKPKTQVRLYYAIVSYVTSLIEGGAE